MALGFLYVIYINIYFYYQVFIESIANVLNFLRLFRRQKAKLPASLVGKTVVITGANSGIGKITALKCAQLGAKVILACRDMAKAQKSLEEMYNELDKEHRSNLELIQLDLSSLESVRKCAATLNDQVSQIDYLINNAGIMMCPEMQSADGLELQFATNHLGHFLFTNLLVDKLKAAPKARVVNLSSIAHLRGEIHFDNINLKDSYSPLKSYTQSKLANVLFSVELARRLRNTNIKVYAVHPGLVNTELKRYLNKLYMCFLYFLDKMILITPELGAQTTLYCAFEESIQNESGFYYANCRRVKKMLPHAVDEIDAAKLWELSLKLCSMENNNIL